MEIKDGSTWSARYAQTTCVERFLSWAVDYVRLVFYVSKVVHFLHVIFCIVVYFINSVHILCISKNNIIATHIIFEILIKFNASFLTSHALNIKVLKWWGARNTSSLSCIWLRISTINSKLTSGSIQFNLFSLF